MSMGTPKKSRAGNEKFSMCVSDKLRLISRMPKYDKGFHLEGFLVVIFRDMHFKMVRKDLTFRISSRQDLPILFKYWGRF